MIFKTSESLSHHLTLSSNKPVRRGFLNPLLWNQGKSVEPGKFSKPAEFHGFKNRIIERAGTDLLSATVPVKGNVLII